MLRKILGFEIVCIFLVSFLSLYKTLGFYFWHDDFSIVYAARVGKCLFGWPYDSYCTLMPFLDKFFNYNSGLYFSFGFILAFISALTFYFFVKHLLPKNIALYSTLLFSTLYIGAGASLEAYSYITTFLSLSLLFITLIFFLRGVSGNNLKVGMVFFGFIFFVFAIIALRARSMMYIIPVLAVVWLFSKRLKVRTRYILYFCLILLHLSVYFFIPFSFNYFGMGTSGSGSVRSYLSELNVFEEIYTYLQTLGSFALTNFFDWSTTGKLNPKMIESIYFASGSILLCAFLRQLILRKREKTITSVRLFALAWIIFIHLPYGLLSSGRLDIGNRYLVFSLPGVILAWGTLYKKRLWKIITIIFIVLSVIQTNIFYNKYYLEGKKRADFYQKLHKVIPQIPSGSTLYFSYPQNIRAQSTDFFRVGHDPSEAALGTEYGFDYKNVRLITEEEILVDAQKNDEIDKNKFYPFYYDGAQITKETDLLYH